ncbi:MAG TPA: IS5 family transposase [Streptosporangiaceae bacterium]|nr:IS5 family transposase [Streptosporangiaceae bacterium]
MPVYPAAAQDASTACASPGCWCRDRRPCYPSDLTDEQWAVLEPRARQVMRELTIAVGRPMVHDLRAMCDAVSYVVKNGVEWRALPVDFPPWEAVYAFWERWNGRGLALELIRRLRELLRRHQGRAAQPSACIADSQIVKAHDTVSKKTSGYHGGKKITGRGRHLAVDAEGWLLALVVTAASVSDKAGAKLLLIKLFNLFSTVKIMWADSGYDGAPLARYAKAAAGITVEVVKRTAPHSFQVLRRRWVIERTFGWLMRYRRLVRDYERTTANSEAMIYWATVLIMTRRLARYETGQPQPARWGRERPRPAQQAALSTGSKHPHPGKYTGDSWAMVTTM